MPQVQAYAFIDVSQAMGYLMTMAKSLAGGMPLSGVVGNAQIMDARHRED